MTSSTTASSPSGEEARRAKRAAYMREYWKRNPDKYNKKYKAQRQMLDDYKANLVCQECGFNHPAALQFHHRDPSTKVDAVTRMVRSGSWDDVLAEIAKCDVLCANCHLIHHNT